MDGLLIDSEPISYQAFNQMLAPKAKHISKVDYANHLSGHRIDENINYLNKTFALDLDLPTGIAKFRALQNSLAKNGLPLRPGALELLNYAKAHHLTIHLATSSHPKKLNLCLKQIIFGIYLIPIILVRKLLQANQHLISF